MICFNVYFPILIPKTPFFCLTSINSQKKTPHQINDEEPQLNNKGEHFVLCVTLHRHNTGMPHPTFCQTS